MLTYFSSCWLVPDDTVHKIYNRPLFVTQGSVTFEFTIAPYKTIIFISSFLYFTLQFYPWTGAAGGSDPPTYRPVMIETAGSSGPCHSSIRGVPSEGYRSRLDVETTWVNRRHIFKWPDQDAHLYHPTDQPWWGPPSHGTTFAVPPAGAPPGTIPRGLQHTWQTGIQDWSDHPGDTDRRLWPNDSDGDQDHQQGLFSQQVGVRRGVLACNHNGRWWHAGGGGPGCPRPTPGLDNIFNALPHAIFSDLLGHHQRENKPQ